MEAFLSKLRGYLALGAVGLSFLVADVLQRAVISTVVKAFPSKRDGVLGRWLRFQARLSLAICTRIGGARFDKLPNIPARSGVLVLMNHQSLLDIPLVIASMDDLYPRIVTRARYARWKPLISHGIRLYQYPLVDPRAIRKTHVRSLEVAAREGNTPLVLFPEGSRARDGEIGRWSRAGLNLLLGERSWTVYVMVADGFLRVARLADFVVNVSAIHGRFACRGPYHSPEPGRAAGSVGRRDEGRDEKGARVRESTGVFVKSYSREVCRLSLACACPAWRPFCRS